MTKLCTFYATKIQINDHEIDLNHDTEAKLGNLKNLLLNDVHIVSSVSAQKLKCPSSARLRTFIARLGSSWKFQLELISSK